MVKIRHRHEPAAALLTPSADPARARLIFEEPQRAITPGQGAYLCGRNSSWRRLDRLNQVPLK